MYTLKLSEDFTKYPSGRTNQDGSTYNGEALRENHLKPLLAKYRTIIVDLDDCDCLPQSFLDEAFGKLAQEIGAEEFWSRIQLVCTDDNKAVKRIQLNVEYRTSPPQRFWISWYHPKNTKSWARSDKPFFIHGIWCTGESWQRDREYKDDMICANVVGINEIQVIADIKTFWPSVVDIRFCEKKPMDWEPEKSFTDKHVTTTRHNNHAT